MQERQCAQCVGEWTKNDKPPPPPPIPQQMTRINVISLGHACVIICNQLAEKKGLITEENH